MEIFELRLHMKLESNVEQIASSEMKRLNMSVNDWTNEFVVKQRKLRSTKLLCNCSVIALDLPNEAEPKLEINFMATTKLTWL